MEMRSQHKQFVEAVEENYDQIWVAEEDERESIVRVEWDDREDSANQITQLQKKVNSTVPIHDGVYVHMADITVNQVTFITQ